MKGCYLGGIMLDFRKITMRDHELLERQGLQLLVDGRNVRIMDGNGAVLSLTEKGSVRLARSMNDEHIINIGHFIARITK